MTAQSYIVKETLIGTVINGLFSVLFVWLIFGQFSQVPIHGPQGLLLDALPQGLAIGFMGAFFPSFLTRRRLRAGQLSGQDGKRSKLPLAPALRALIVAMMAGALSLGLFALVWLPAEHLTLPFQTAVLVKTAWGALLGALVSYVSLKLALSDYRT